MCAACVAQGAAYLVPAYAVVKTRRWQRRRRPGTEAPLEARPEKRTTELTDA